MYGYGLRRLAALGLAAACGWTGAHAQTPGGLDVDVTAAGQFTRMYAWTIDKQVSPANSDRFIGESQQLGYVLSVTKGAPEDSGFFVEGTIRITNPTAATIDIDDVRVTWAGADVADDCGSGALAPGASRTCTLAFKSGSGAGGTLAVDVATAGGGSAGDSTNVAFAPEVVNDTITVRDAMLPEALSFSASATHEYAHTLSCADGNTVVVNNAATIVETGASAAAKARLSCHALRMERAATPGGQGWEWALEKSHAEATPLQLGAGDSHDVLYTITATATATGDGNVVTGTISALNTNPVTDATLESVGAGINGLEATVDCPSLTVPMATYDAMRNIVLGRLDCPFSITLPAGTTATTVSGRVTQQLFAYDADGNGTPSGTRDHAGSQPITGGGDTTDECITLVDDYLGTAHDLGEFCAGAGSTTVSRTFTGTIAVTADSECEFSVPNVARLTTNDSGTTMSDDTLVSVVRTDCGELEASISGSGNFTRTYPWTIEKTVTPESSDRFIGETQELAYTLTLTKGEAQDTGWVVSGTATVHNGSGTSADLTAITIMYGTMPVVHGCATGPLAAGATLTCPLSFPVADDTPQTLTLDVDTSGTIEGVEASAAVTFGAPTTTNDSVTVTDTLLSEKLSFSASGTHAYTHDVTCVDGNTITVDNTATIVETGASDSARARVACHALRMERSATPGGSEWTWTLEKTHAEAEPLQLAAGSRHDVIYTITATATASGGGGGSGGTTVTGAISALNTHPTIDAQLVSVLAKINGLDATVNCPSLVVPHATYDAAHNIVVGRLDCPYTITLPAGQTASTVYGRLTQQLFDYDAEGNATADGTRIYEGTQPIAPGAGTQTDECITLVDDYLGTTHDLGEFCASAGSTTVSRNFTGTVAVTADSECEFSVPNVARLTTNDSGTTVQDDTLVSVMRTDCGELEATISGSGNFTRTYPWTIDKTVTPESSDRFIGETQELAYTLTLTKGEAQDAGWVVSGNATVHNASGTTATITALTVMYGAMPVVHGCATGPLAPGATLTCPLSFPVADDTPQMLTLDVDTSGTIEGVEASAAVTFGAPTTTNDSVTVMDTLLTDTLSFSASGTHEYTHDVTCVDGNTIVVDNTATIVETGASDSARARVACHALRMERAVTPAGGRSWSWQLDKSHDQALPLELAAGQSHTVDYTITATATATAAGGGAVTGAISALNTHPTMDAQLVSVHAQINGLDATVNCPSLVVPHATYDAAHNLVVGRLDCPFTITLPEGQVATSVYGRLTQQLFDYSAKGDPTSAGTRIYEGTQAVPGAGGGSGEQDECITLVDDYLGTSHELGTFCASDGDTTFSANFAGTITVGKEDDCLYFVPNVARLTTNDSGTTDEDATSVEVRRTDCDEQLAACTRTQGYWKTHSSAGPAPYDATWAAIGEDTTFFRAGGSGKPQSWLEVMWLAPKGNAYYVLAHQFIAATLNLEAGTDASAKVLDALDQSQALFETWSAAEIGALRGNNEPRPQMIELAGTLDQYNNGLLGTKHCDSKIVQR